MPIISLIINVDTRRGIEQNESAQNSMLEGTRSFDFLYEGVINKINFFRGYDMEIILFVDRHLNVPLQLLEKWQEEFAIPFTFCISSHKTYFGEHDYYPKWNDLNFLQALFLARGKWIAHFDGDMNAFREDDCKIIDEIIELLNKYDYISYPSPWSPAPIFNDGKWDYWWASTRFFFCKRETLDFTEIMKCLQNSEYLYGKYPTNSPKCPWLEHILGMIAGPGKVYYLPMSEEYLIFSWNKYKVGTLKMLNENNYDFVNNFVGQKGGISYPCDIAC